MEAVQIFDSSLWEDQTLPNVGTSLFEAEDLQLKQSGFANDGNLAYRYQLSIAQDS